MARTLFCELLTSKNRASNRHLATGFAILGKGAEHTFSSGLPLPRESGFFISTWRAKPGSVLAIKDPYGESGRPDLRQVFKYPALAHPEQARQRPRTNLSSFLEDAMKRQHSTPHTPKIGLQEGVE